ncbi:VOC family protein [Sphingobacterium oryzagri]|uniref:VOC family protein n=1 Tax=Sphingobacterium oryzagri TaxID=3025669 RepID=A0ABY7WKZ1_9SPHI|nr:VOC family protein [Sphingobacterium sp. KACC 22765]WDF70267.1 VOC family protein [Sphingobacterium sp. KACC 22765]
MVKIHAYLNFNGNCEEAFTFYQTVFGGPLLGLHRFGDMPADPDFAMPDAEKNKIMHTALHINKDVMLMGSDCIENFGHKAVFGTATYIMLDTETIDEARALHTKLSDQAQVIEMDLAETFFAELYSSFTDRFGISWMIHYEGNKKMG